MISVVGITVILNSGTLAGHSGRRLMNAVTLPASTTLIAVPHLEAPQKACRGWETKASGPPVAKSSQWAASSGEEPDRIDPNGSASIGPRRPERENCARRLA